MMNSLLNITLPKKKYIDSKKIILKKNNIIYKKKNTFIKLSSNPRIFSIYATLLSENSAKFSDNRYFYNCLESFKQQHFDFLGYIPKKYNLPYDDNIFYFKNLKRFLLCKNYKNDIINWKECYNKKVKFKLRVKPYEYNNNIGLVIQVSEINVI